MNDHDHHHPTMPDADEPLTEHQCMEIALRELLIEKKIITADEIRAAIEVFDSITPARGGQVVARAWTDPGFRQRLLTDGAGACRELDIDIGPTRLIAVENTEVVHNVVVCTLCSCYPRMLLGLPPDWYKSAEYRSRTANEPRAVLAEFGTVIPENVTLRVHDSTADMRYLVVPRQPDGTNHLDESELAELVTRDSMIGVSLPKTV